MANKNFFQKYFHSTPCENRNLEFILLERTCFSEFEHSALSRTSRTDKNRSRKSNVLRLFFPSLLFFNHRFVNVFIPYKNIFEYFYYLNP